MVSITQGMNMPEGGGHKNAAQKLSDTVSKHFKTASGALTNWWKKNSNQ